MAFYVPPGFLVPWAAPTKYTVTVAERAAEVQQKAPQAVQPSPAVPWLELGGFILLVSIAKAIKEQGVGTVFEKLTGVLNSRAVEQGLRSIGNIIVSLIQAGACNRIVAFGSVSLAALILEQLHLIPRGSSPWIIGLTGVITGAEYVTEGMETFQGWMPFTSTTTTDTDFPSTVVFSVENPLPDRRVAVEAGGGRE